MNYYDNRALGHWPARAQASALAIPETHTGSSRRDEAPLFYFFDGKSVTPYNGSKRGGADMFSSGYGVTAAVLRPGKLQQNDWDFARAYVQSEYAFRCIEMVANDIGAIKHGVRNRRTKADMPEHPLMQALTWARKVCQQDIIKLWQKALYIFGETYLLPVSNGFTNPASGKPYYNGLQWLNPLVTEPYIAYGQLQGYDYSAYGYHRFHPSEIAHDKIPSMFDDIRGQSLISAVLASVNIDIEIKRYTLDSFLKDMRMSGILTGREGSDLKQTDVDAALQIIKEKKESRLIALAPALVWQQVQHQWDDSQFKASDDARRRITTGLGIPMSVVGAWDDAHYQSAPAQLAFYYDHVIFREEDRLALFINDVLIPYYDPYGEGEWYYDKDSAAALTEDKATKSQMYGQQFESGGLTLNEYRQAIGQKTLVGGDVLALNGQIIPISGLAQATQQDKPEIFQYHIEGGIVQKNEVRQRLGLLPLSDDDGKKLTDLQSKLALLQSAITAGIPLEQAALLTGLTIPSLPVTTVPTDSTIDTAKPKAVEPVAQPGMKDAWVGLTLPNHPDLIPLQTRAKQLIGEGECKWSDPADFHVTLLYIPAISDESASALTEALNEVDVPELALRVGSLGVFDNVGEHALHFKIRSNTDLKDLQETLYDICGGLGLQMRSFYQPAAYQPHITVGYAQQPLRRVVYTGKTVVQPSEMHLSVGGEVVYRKACGKPKPVKASVKGALFFQADVEYVDATPYAPISCASCRWFSSEPNTAPCHIVINAPLTIVPDGWCKKYEVMPDRSVEVVYTEDYAPDNPNLVAEQIPPEVRQELLENAQLATTPPAPAISPAIIEAVPALEAALTAQIASDDDRLTIDSTAQTIAARSASSEEVWPGVWSDNTPPEWLDAARHDEWRQVWTRHHEQVKANSDSDSPDEVAMHTHIATREELGFPLKTIHEEALGELDAWLKKTKNKGAVKALDFQTYLIRDAVATGIRLALTEAGDDKAAVKAIFDNAREVIGLKAVQATRLDFENGFEDILNDALAGNLTRRRWSTLTRNLIGVSINKAYRDGLADGGVDDEPDDTEQKAIDAMIASQSTYVTNLGVTLFKTEDKISDAMATQKPAMWWNGSIAPAYSAGLLSADANSMYIWHLGQTEEHCLAEKGKWGCKTLDGTRKRYKTWKKLNLIAGTIGQNTTCGGYRCDCKQVRAAGKSSDVVLDEADFQHDHVHDLVPGAGK